MSIRVLRDVHRQEESGAIQDVRVMYGMKKPGKSQMALAIRHKTDVRARERAWMEDSPRAHTARMHQTIAAEGRIEPRDKEAARETQEYLVLVDDVLAKELLHKEQDRKARIDATPSINVPGSHRHVAHEAHGEKTRVGNMLRSRAFGSGRHMPMPMAPITKQAVSPPLLLRDADLAAAPEYTRELERAETHRTATPSRRTRSSLRTIPVADVD